MFMLLLQLWEKPEVTKISIGRIRRAVMDDKKEPDRWTSVAVMDVEAPTWCAIVLTNVLRRKNVGLVVALDTSHHSAPTTRETQTEGLLRRRFLERIKGASGS